MRESLHLLVAGWDPPGATAAALRDARLGVFLDALAMRNVEVRPWTSLAIGIPDELRDRPLDAVRSGSAFLDPADLVWPDAILLRAGDLAGWVCDTCDRVAYTDEALHRHVQATGHCQVRKGPLTPHLLVEAFEARPTLLRNRALVLDLDEGLSALDPGGVAAAEIVRRAARLADLVIVSTETMRADFAPRAADVRVVRDAVDPCWVAGGASGGGRPRDDTNGHVAVALGGLDAAREIVTAFGSTPAASVTGLWLHGGALDVPGVRGAELPVAADDAARLLASTGAVAALLAPPGREDAGSELPWLLASIAGIPAVGWAGERSRSPYGSFADGELLVAADAADWRRAVSRLAGSGDLRAELVAKSLDRVRREYALDDRADEWADAFEFGASHAGCGRAAAARHSRLRPGSSAPAASARGVDGAAVASTSIAAAAALAHRRRMRDEAEAAKVRLEELRGGRDVCWPADMPDEPLVSVVIPTFSRGRVLTERSLASVLAQTYERIEVVVVGDHATEETIAAMASVNDPRVRFVDLPERSPYQENPFLRWLQVGTRPFNRAMSLARGHFIAPNADDDEFTPNHVEQLLSVALEYRLEFVYGDSLMELADGSWTRVGEWPPAEGRICGGAVLYAAPLRFIEMDEECWRDLEPNDWSLFRRMLDAGATAGHLPEIVFRHYAEGREWQPGSRDSALRRAG